MGRFSSDDEGVQENVHMRKRIRDLESFVSRFLALGTESPESGKCIYCGMTKSEKHYGFCLVQYAKEVMKGD